MTRKVPTVNFNMNDDYERELYEFAIKQQRFFSRYIKRLIERDRAGGMSSVPIPQVPEIAPKLSDEAYDVSSFL